MELQFISVLAEAKPSLHALSALYCVGGDAHIAPAEQSVFTGIFGEFDRALGSMWASTPTNFYEVDPNFAHKNGLRILPDKGHAHTAGPPRPLESSELGISSVSMPQSFKIRFVT